MRSKDSGLDFFKELQFLKITRCPVICKSLATEIRYSFRLKSLDIHGSARREECIKNCISIRLFLKLN